MYVCMHVRRDGWMSVVCMYVCMYVTYACTDMQHRHEWRTHRQEALSTTKDVFRDVVAVV